jgi:serine/threonine protein kinase
MLVKLDHPSIVNIYEVYEAEQCLILVLEYMAGGELYEQISQRKRLTEAEVRYSLPKIGHLLIIQELHQGFSGCRALLPRIGRHSSRHQGRRTLNQP